MAFWSHGGTRRVSIYGCWHMLQQIGDVAMCGGAALKTRVASGGASGRARPAVCDAICLLQSGSDPTLCLLGVGFSLPVMEFASCLLVWMASRPGFVWWCNVFCCSLVLCAQLFWSTFRPV